MNKVIVLAKLRKANIINKDWEHLNKQGAFYECLNVELPCWNSFVFLYWELRPPGDNESLSISLLVLDMKDIAIGVLGIWSPNSIFYRLEKQLFLRQNKSRRITNTKKGDHM